MMNDMKKKGGNIKSFDELIEAEHGKLGTESRNQYEEGSHKFIIDEAIKEASEEVKSSGTTRRSKDRK